MTVSNATLEAALAPYRGSPSFNAGPSWDLLRAYVASVEKAGLVLSDSDIAAGIASFGRWHIAQFGEGVTAWSSPVAVAAQSVEEAIDIKTGKPAYSSPFYAAVSASGDLAKGDQAGMLAGQIAYRNQPGMSYGSFGFFDNLLFTAVPVAMSAIVGGAALGEMGAVFGEGATAASAADLATIDAAAGMLPEYGSIAANTAVSAADLASIDAAAGLLPEYGSIAANTAVSAADLASIDAAAGLVPEYGTSATYSAGIAGTAEGASTVSPLEESIGNFGDWFQTTEGTMYNPQTGEYLTADGTYNAGSLGSSAPGGADAYSFSTDFLSTSSASNASLVNDIFSTPGKFLSSIKSALAGLGGVQASLSQRQPNYTRAVGQVNLALPLLAVAGYFMLRG
jgi:hypothetical protein